MLELSSISLTVFSYVTEENSRVVQALYNCMPSEYHAQKLTKISSNSQFGDPLVIYSFDTDDTLMVKKILAHIASNLDEKSKDYLLRNLEKKTDLENRSIYIRFDKYKAFEGEIYITEGGDIIKCELGYNAYTQDDNTIENVKQLLQELKVIK